MKFALLIALPHLLSIITVVSVVLAGNQNRWAWAVALLGQVGWSAWILMSGEYGFLLMNVVLWAVYLRNHLKWFLRRTPKQDAEQVQMIRTFQAVAQQRQHPCISCSQNVNHRCTSPKQFNDFSCWIPKTMLQPGAGWPR